MTQQDRTIIMVVVGVVIAAASWFLLIKPERQKATKAQAQVEVAQAAADGATAQAASAAAARAKYDRDYATVVRLGKAVPTDSDIASLVYQLDQTADESGVDFRSVNVTATASDTGAAAGANSGAAATSSGLPGGVTTVPVTLKFTGTYFEMTRFLHKIERYTITRGDDIDVRGRLVSVDGVTLTPGLAGFPQVSAEVQATVYRAPLDGVSSDGGDATSGSAATPASSQTSTTPQSGSSSGGTAAPAAAAAKVVR